MKRYFKNIDKSTSLHASKCCQEWLANNVPAFIRAKDWKSGGAGLNPIDYELYDILDRKRFENAIQIWSSLNEVSSRKRQKYL